MKCRFHIFRTYFFMSLCMICSLVSSAHADTPHEIIQTMHQKLATERLRSDTKEFVGQALSDPQSLTGSRPSLYDSLRGLEEIYEYNNRYHRAHRPILLYLIEQSDIGEIVSAPDSSQKRYLEFVAAAYLQDIDARFRRAVERQNLERTMRHHDAISTLSEDVTIPVSPESETYQSIVIDISEQRIYTYEEGILVATSPITSGMSRFPTPTGIFQVQKKQLNKFMKSPFKNESYALHVDYWVQFFPKYGIHDSCNSRNCWRTVFGGQDYKTRGSHGCINAPYEFISWMYSWVLPGTTVQVQR